MEYLGWSQIGSVVLVDLILSVVFLILLCKWVGVLMTLSVKVYWTLRRDVRKGERCGSGRSYKGRYSLNNLSCSGM